MNASEIKYPYIWRGLDFLNLNENYAYFYDDDDDDDSFRTMTEAINFMLMFC